MMAAPAAIHWNAAAVKAASRGDKRAFDRRGDASGFVASGARGSFAGDDSGDGGRDTIAAADDSGSPTAYRLVSRETWQ